MFVEMQAAQAAAKPAAAKGKVQEDEEDLDPNQYFERRVKAVKDARDAGENPYPHKFHVSSSIPDFIAKYGHLKEGEHLQTEEVSIAGI